VHRKEKKEAGADNDNKRGQLRKEKKIKKITEER